MNLTEKNKRKHLLNWNRMYRSDREKKSKLLWRNSQNGQHKEQKIVLLENFLIYFFVRTLCLFRSGWLLCKNIYLFIGLKNFSPLEHWIVGHLEPYHVPWPAEGAFSEKCASNSTESEAMLPICINVPKTWWCRVLRHTKLCVKGQGLVACSVEFLWLNPKMSQSVEMLPQSNQWGVFLEATKLLELLVWWKLLSRLLYRETIFRFIPAFLLCIC